MIVGFWCLTAPSTIFQLYRFFVEEPEYPEKTTDLSQVTDKRYQIIEYTSPWKGFELTTLLMIGTDCVGSCKSKQKLKTSTGFSDVLSTSLALNRIVSDFVSF